METGTPASANGISCHEWEFRFDTKGSPDFISCGMGGNGFPSLLKCNYAPAPRFFGVFSS